MLKAIIFDVDGIIAETESIHLKAFQKTFDSFKINLTPEYHRSLIGSTVKDNIVKINKDFNIDVDVEEYAKVRNEEYISLLEKNTIRPNQGLKEILLWGKKNRIKLGICSSSKKTMVVKVLEGVFKKMEISESIYNYFDAFATAEDVRRKKPFPDIYLYVINKLNLQSSECLAIEDSEIGINSAKSAGCRVIGLITPFNTIDDIINADKIVKSLEEILKEKFWGWFNDR